MLSEKKDWTALTKRAKVMLGFPSSLRVYSDISGWVKLKFLKQFLPFPPLSLAREGESQRKQLPQFIFQAIKLALTWGYLGWEDVNWGLCVAALNPIWLPPLLERLPPRMGRASSHRLYSLHTPEIKSSAVSADIQR